MKSKLELNPKFWSSKLETEEKQKGKMQFRKYFIEYNTISL